MEYVYTTLLLHETKQEINEESVKKVLNAVNATVDEGKVKALVASLADVNIDEAVKEVPVATAPAAAEAKKEEVKEEPKVDENKAAAGLGSLFG
tara:strand:- start:676 stop:957 length:282 start_codon:yes stop_codon:yes gene_type:complete